MKKLFCDKSEWLFTEYAYNIYEKCLYNKTYKEYKRIMSTYWDHPDVKCFYCSDDGKNVGIIVFQFLRDGVAEILGVAVHESYRNRGVGTFMVREAAKIINAPKILAETDGDAIGFYKKLGFEIIEEEVKHYVDGDEFRYSCQLEC